MKSIRLVSFAALTTAFFATCSAGCSAIGAEEEEPTGKQASAFDKAQLANAGTLATAQMTTRTPDTTPVELVPVKSVDKPVSLTGVLTRSWVGIDKTSKLTGARTDGYRYFLSQKLTKDLRDKKIPAMQEVVFSPETLKASGGLGKLYGHKITVSGHAWNINAALIGDLMVLAPEDFGPPPETKDPLVGQKHWLTVQCRFSDIANPDPHPQSYFDGIMGQAAPGAGDFFAKASYGKMSLDNTTLDWADMPFPQSQYFQADGSPRLDNILGDCLTNAFFAPVDLGTIDGFSLVYSHNIGVGVTGGTIPMDFGPGLKNYGFALLQPSDYVNQEGVVRGIGLGLSMTLSGSAPMQLDSPWDFMSLGYSTTNGITCRSLTQGFGCAGVFPAAEQAARSGWLDGAAVGSVSTDGIGTFELDFVGNAPQAGHVGLVRLPTDSQHWFTVEARNQKPGTYDVGVPKTDIVVHSMNGVPLPIDATPAEALTASTRLKPIESLNGSLAFVDGTNRFKITATPRAYGYTVTIARGPTLRVNLGGQSASVQVWGTGSGITCGLGSNTCAAAETFDSTFTLQALAIQGKRVSGWSGCTPIDDTHCSVTMDRSKTVSVTIEDVQTGGGCTCLPSWPVYKCQQICGGGF